MSPPWTEEGVIIVQLVAVTDDNREGSPDLTGCFAVRVSRDIYMQLQNTCYISPQKFLQIFVR